MHSPEIQHISIADSIPEKASYITFESVLKFNDFVNAQTKVLSASNSREYTDMQERANQKILQQSSWYGTPVPNSITDLQGHNHFLAMHLSAQIAPKIKETLNRYIALTKDKIITKPKLSYNDRGLGVFSFDRAAMGLHRLQPTAKDTPMITLSNQLKIALDRDNKVTTIKEVYANFEHKNSPNKAMELYVMAGGNANVEGDALLYVGLAIAELVEFMTHRGIATQVHVILATTFQNKLYAAIVKVKGYENPLDKNQLLLLSSDPRYFRYKGFEALIAISDYLGSTIPTGLGSTAYNITHFVSAITHGEGIVFNQSYAMDSAVKEVTQIITNYTKDNERQN